MRPDLQLLLLHCDKNHFRGDKGSKRLAVAGIEQDCLSGKRGVYGVWLPVIDERVPEAVTQLFLVHSELIQEQSN